MVVIELGESKTQTDPEHLQENINVAEPGSAQKNATDTEPNPVQENDFFTYTTVDTQDEAMAVIRQHEQAYTFRFSIYHVAGNFGNVGKVFYTLHLLFVLLK